jgi:hypothetical protein
MVAKIRAFAKRRATRRHPILRARTGRAFPFCAVAGSLISPMKEGLQALPTLEAPHDSDGTVYRCPAAEKPFDWKGLPFVHQFTAPTTACKGGPVAMRAKVGQYAHRTDNRPNNRPPRALSDAIDDLHRVVRLRKILTDFERSEARAEALIRQGPPFPGRSAGTKGGVL